MSVKIKINWNNENVVSESVRIYRADSAFTTTLLPPLLSEIFGDVYEYEDLSVIEDQTYFYMLSAKLDEQEVFTDCFEVSSNIGVKLIDLNLKTITRLSKTGSNNRIRGGAALSNGNFVVGGYDVGTKNSRLSIYDAQFNHIEDIDLGVKIVSFSIIDGKYLCLRQVDKTELYEMSTKNDLSTRMLVSTSVNFINIDGLTQRIAFFNERTCAALDSNSYIVKIAKLNNPSDLSAITSVNPYNIEGKLIKRTASSVISGISMSSNGMELIVITGTYAYENTIRLHHFDLTEAFNLDTANIRYRKDLSGNTGSGFPLSFNDTNHSFVLGEDNGGFCFFKYN